MNTTEADANDEFARWLAEMQAKQTADAVRPESSPADVQPTSAPARRPESAFTGPQVARQSFQPIGGATTTVTPVELPPESRRPTPPGLGQKLPPRPLTPSPLVPPVTPTASSLPPSTAIPPRAAPPELPDEPSTSLVEPSAGLATDDPLAQLFGGLNTVATDVPVVPDPAKPAAVSEPMAELAAPEPIARLHATGESFAPDPSLLSVSAQPPELAAPPAIDVSPGGGQRPGFFGRGGDVDADDPEHLERATTVEKITLGLAFVVPPVGLIASIVAAVQSLRRRGWVHGLVRAAVAIAIVMTIVSVFAGAYVYKLIDDQRRFDSVAAASTQFCATVAEQPDMIQPPTFGFPGPGASIPDTIVAMQAWVDRWDALATVSPSGIRQNVTNIADSGRAILTSVETTRLVNDQQNVATMSAVTQASGVDEWAETYCG